jgi:hypothetical protein
MVEAWPFAAEVVLVVLNDWPVAPAGVLAIAKVTLVPETGLV